MKLTLTLLVVVLLGVVMLRDGVVGTTFANNTPEGGLQLTIDSHSIYNGVFQPELSWELKDLVPGVDRFFNFTDIKPGDTGTSTISIHVEDNPAYVCLDFTNLADEENGVNEPESHVDLTPGGDLSGGIEFFAWMDDGDNTFEVGERPLFGTSSQSAVVVLNDTTYPLSDATTEEPFEEGETNYVGITWCAGDLEVDLDTAVVTCNPLTLGNEYQTDSFTVDVTLRAVEANSFTDFTCEDPRITLELEKKFSGPTEGFVPEQFSFHVYGTSTKGEYFDEIIPHGGTIDLPIGFFHIEEVVPEGFDIPDWRIQWSGGMCDGENIAGGKAFIEVEANDIKKVFTNCRADNQFRPENGNNGHGNDEDGNDDSNPGNSNNPDDDTDDDGLPPGQQNAGGPPGQQSASVVSGWSVVEEEGRFERSRIGRLLSKLRRS